MPLLPDNNANLTMRLFDLYSNFGELAFQTPPPESARSDAGLRNAVVFAAVRLDQEIDFPTQDGGSIRGLVGDFILTSTIPGNFHENATPIMLLKAKSEFPGTDFEPVDGSSDLYRFVGSSTDTEKAAE